MADSTPRDIVRAIADLVSYNWADEERDYNTEALEPGNSRESHIFRDLLLIQQWLETFGYPHVEPHITTPEHGGRVMTKAGTIHPRTIPLEDGALRIFEPELDTDDRSRMYVLDLFEMGVIINVRLIADEGNPAGSRPKVVIETELWPLDAEVCGVESTYGQET